MVSQYDFLVELHPKTLSEPNVPRRVKHGTSTRDFVRALTSQASSPIPRCKLDTEPLTRSYSGRILSCSSFNYSPYDSCTRWCCHFTRFVRTQAMAEDRGALRQGQQSVDHLEQVYHQRTGMHDRSGQYRVRRQTKHCISKLVEVFGWGRLCHPTRMEGKSFRQFVFCSQSIPMRASR